MKDLIRFMVESVVNECSEIDIVEKDEEKSTVFEITVSDKDVGKLIGKKGRTINAIRTIAKAAVNKTDKKVMVEVLQ